MEIGMTHGGSTSLLFLFGLLAPLIRPDGMEILILLAGDLLLLYYVSHPNRERKGWHYWWGQINILHVSCHVLPPLWTGGYRVKKDDSTFMETTMRYIYKIWHLHKQTDWLWLYNMDQSLSLLLLSSLQNIHIHILVFNSQTSFFFPHLSAALFCNISDPSFVEKKEKDGGLRVSIHHYFQPSPQCEG